MITESRLETSALVPGMRFNELCLPSIKSTGSKVAHSKALSSWQLRIMAMNVNNLRSEAWIWNACNFRKVSFLRVNNGGAEMD